MIVFDKLTYAGSLLNLRGVDDHPFYSFVCGDIADRDAIKSVIERWRPDAIVNFAAETHVDRSIDGPRSFVRTNVNGTFELLEAARQYWLNLTPGARDRFRLLHVSTDEVFGSLGVAGRFHEDTAYAPNSPYAASKASSDHSRAPTIKLTVCPSSLPIARIITDIPISGKADSPRRFSMRSRPAICASMATEAMSATGYSSKTTARESLPSSIADTSAQTYNIGGKCERTNLEVIAEVSNALEDLLPSALNPGLIARGVTNYSELKSCAGSSRTDADTRSIARESNVNSAGLHK